MKDKTLSQLMTEIRKDYAAKGKPVHYAARPYVDALAQCATLNDRYGVEAARDLVPYLLCNLQGWRGDAARAVKAELNRRLREE